MSVMYPHLNQCGIYPSLPDIHTSFKNEKDDGDNPNENTRDPISIVGQFRSVDHYSQIMDNEVGPRKRRRQLAKHVHFELPSEKAFAVHKLQPGDTLERLALLYGIQMEDIRMANGMLAELDFFPKQELIIPNPRVVPTADTLARADVPSIDSALLEKQRQQWTMQFFCKTKGCTGDIARYYLLLHDFEIGSAMREYDDDVRWEMQQKRMAIKRQRQRRIRFWRRYTGSIPVVKHVASLLANCILVDDNLLDGDQPLNELEQVRLLSGSSSNSDLSGISMKSPRSPWSVNS